MTDYLLITMEDEDAHAAEPPHAMAALIAARARFVERVRAAGKLREAGRLHASREGARVRREGDRLDVRGGPFAEEGRAIGGWVWVEAADIGEAAALAGELPALPTDVIEVRPVQGGALAVNKDDAPGKLVAGLVLGSGATEAAWTMVMDRIEHETRGRFPEASFLGGVRLDPPSRGRRVVTRGERRATLDGPFLESKEVIGGLFILRTASFEEALRWCAATPFVVHGTLELREPWRT